MICLGMAGFAMGEVLNEANFSEWMESVRPTAEEEGWKKIPWRNGFMEAVAEAKELDRPVLLWTMNGNPCGET